MRYAVDFETFYDREYSLKEMPTAAYVRHARFDAYMVSVLAFDGSLSYVGRPENFNWAQLEGQELWSHNASFDKAVALRLIELGRIPAFKEKVWHCSADMVAYFLCPRSLDKASEFLLAEKVDKSARAMMQGREFESLNDAEKAKMLDYCLTDDKVLIKLVNQMVDKWPEWEQKLSVYARESGLQGFRIDVPLAHSYKDKTVTMLHEANLCIPWDWSDKKTPLSPTQIRQHARDAGIWAPASFAKDNVKCMEWEDEFAARFPWVKAIRDWRRVNMLDKKIGNLLSSLRGEWFAFNLKYFGAHSGRFSGEGSKFNMQNLPRDPDEMYGIDLRALFLPDSPEEKLFVVDLAQIEARVLLWFAGDQATLNLIREGFGVYEAHARAYMGWNGPAKTLKKTDPALYQLAKARVLGCGYGASGTALRRVAKTMCGLDLDVEEAKRVVAEYRASNPRVTTVWHKMGRVLAMAAADNKKELRITMPSGRDLIYFEPKIVPSDKNQWAQYDAQYVMGDTRKKVYGGLMTENMIQALARDIFLQAVVRMYDKGLKVKLTVHDEVIVSAPSCFNVREIEEEFEKQPDWAEKPLPLGCESAIVDRYTK